jgi:hypothetical protein
MYLLIIHLRSGHTLDSDEHRASNHARDVMPKSFGLDTLERCIIRPPLSPDRTSDPAASVTI